MPTPGHKFPCHKFHRPFSSRIAFCRHDQLQINSAWSMIDAKDTYGIQIPTPISKRLKSLLSARPQGVKERKTAKVSYGSLTLTCSVAEPTMEEISEKAHAESGRPTSSRLACERSSNHQTIFIENLIYAPGDPGWFWHSAAASIPSKLDFFRFRRDFFSGLKNA
jgi:hypothetical protein